MSRAWLQLDLIARVEARAHGLTVLRFTNNHLVYALTWSALALMAAGWTVMLNRAVLSEQEDAA